MSVFPRTGSDAGAHSTRNPTPDRGTSGGPSEMRASLHEMTKIHAGEQTKPLRDPYIRQEGVGWVAPARMGSSMPGSRSVADSLANRLADIIDRIFGSIAAPAKPVPVPVPARARPTYRRTVRR